ncbi:MAG: hypothetical protein NTZ11_10830 [Gammaproteobacteria bacterium]|nr:hypothetical protein [Gammaproteobacteria bacterium]
MAAFCAPFWLAWRAGYNTRSAEIQEAQTRDTATQMAWLVDQHERNAQLAGDYVLRRAATRTRYLQVFRSIPDVTSEFRPAPGAPLQPIPGCVFTGGAVRLWNRALEGAADDSAAAGRVPAAAGTAGAADPELHGGR